jgi:hypothetical protein
VPGAGRACVPVGSGDDVFGRALVTVVALRRSARGSQDAQRRAPATARDPVNQMRWREAAGLMGPYASTRLRRSLRGASA